MTQKTETPIQKVIRLLGGQDPLKTLLGVKYQSQISAWATGRRPVPPRHCLTIVKHPKIKGVVSKQDLRPDIFLSEDSLSDVA